MLTSIYLVEGQRQMLIRPRDGIATAELDFGFPEIRAVVDNRSDVDGTNDTTQLLGASSVSLQLQLYQAGTTRAIIDELKSFCLPGLRPYMVVSDDEWFTDRRIMLRADQLSAPITKGVGASRFVQVQWRAPDGVWVASSETELTVNADIITTDGIELPITLPVSFATSTSSGAVNVANLGGLPSHFTAKLYGPCTGPSLVHVDTGDEITFIDSLILGAGEYVEIDTRERSAFFLSDTTQSKLDYVDFSVTDWWRLLPGDQSVRYAPNTVSGAAAAVITYRPSWL